NMTTLLHEVGHGMGLRHGGGPPVQLANGSFVAQPNCKSNYLSVMNYTFQVSGVTDAGGISRIDLSRQELSSINEGNLREDLSAQPGWGAMAYRTSWYAPLANVGSVSGPVERHCDGSFITNSDSFVRVNGLDQTGRIDWNVDNDTTDTDILQDVNFNSLINDGTNDHLAFNGFNDFEHLDLRQVGSRRNAGSER